MFLVGCPITYHREWIFEQWYEHVIQSLKKASVHHIGFVFVTTPDDPIQDLIRSTVEYPDKIVEFEQKYAIPEVRAWNVNRYQDMVSIRNELLKTVRAIGPEYFLSLDSDILLHEDAISSLLDALGSAIAVGGKCYMTPRSTMFPSYANLNPSSGALMRWDATGVLDVEVIMAIKLMTPAAYHIDYEYHDKGEDIGWSINARKIGKLLWDGRIESEHRLQHD